MGFEWDLVDFTVSNVSNGILMGHSWDLKGFWVYFEWDLQGFEWYVMEFWWDLVDFTGHLLGFWCDIHGSSWGWNSVICGWEKVNSKLQSCCNEWLSDNNRGLTHNDMGIFYATSWDRYVAPVSWIAKLAKMTPITRLHGGCIWIYYGL